MAFNFVKKIFSFGKKQVEEVPAETPKPEAAPSLVEGQGAPASTPSAEVLPPIREPEPITSDPLREEIAPEAPLPPLDGEGPAAGRGWGGAEAPPPSSLRDDASPIEGEEDARPPTVPRPDKVAEPTPTKPDIPHPAPGTPPPQPEPVPPEVPPETPETPPEPRPDIPAPRPSPATPEIPPEAPSAKDTSSRSPDESGSGLVEEAGEGQREPSAEILPPIREPEPVPSDPLRAEVAPEPAPLPPLDGEGPAKGRGWRDTEIPPPSSLRDDSSPIEGEEDARLPTVPRPDKVTVARKVEAKAAPTPAPAPAPRQSWFQRMRAGLSRSSKELSANIAGVFTKRKLDEDTLQDLEDVLIRADLGMETAIRVTDALASGRFGRDISDAEVRSVMAVEMEKVLAPVALPLELDLGHKPHVILVVGVNGTGKTTTIGKLAAKLAEGGLSVMLAAGDTFRAAAIEQLKIWGERTGSPVVASKLGADAAGLAWDAFERAKEAGSDVLIIDTAGRLQNKAELMAELEKIVRVLGKLDPEAPHTVLQTVDATTGQNALNQVEIFRNVAGVNGLVMTKLDGTARGGILVAIAAKHKLPVYFIGVGEQVDDLEPFSANEFARAIAGVN